MANVVELEHVRKAYGRQVAVNDVTFSVKAGGIFGLLGPNGAGKTSTIRMINGITYPDTGNILLFGEPQRAEHQNRIGYMPEERGLYKKLPVRAQLEYLGSLKGLNRHDLRERIDYWLDRFEIRSWEKKKTNELSKGMQQKLQFIVTVLHDPELLILDEPLSGLDPINAEIIDEVILELRRSGKTILLSTHRMEQVEQLCDDIVLMNLGAVVLSGSLRALKRSSGRLMIHLRYNGDENWFATVSTDGFVLRESHPNDMLIEALPGSNPSALLREATDHVEVIHWEIVEPPIKELFLEAVGESDPRESFTALEPNMEANV